MIPLPPFIQGLILVNVGMFCLPFLFRAVAAWLPLFPLGIGFMPWQLVTFPFIHLDFVTLMFNMLALWMFGGELFMLWGRKRFMQFFAACVLSTAVTYLLLSLVLTSGLSPLTGTSGVIFGMLMAYGMLFPDRTITPLIPPIPMKAKVYVAIFAAVMLLLGASASFGSAAHLANLGGMVGAFLILQFWRGKPPFRRRRR